MPKTRMESSVRITFLKPQSATVTLFLTPIPQISHFDLFNFKPEYFEKMLKLLMISVETLNELRQYRLQKMLCRQHRQSEENFYRKY